MSVHHCLPGFRHAVAGLMLSLACAATAVAQAVPDSAVDRGADAGLEADPGAEPTPAPEALDQPTFTRPTLNPVLRYQEDWSALADRDAAAATTGDFWDPIKYVPLSDDGAIWASFGGQIRLRLESWDDFNFAPRDDDAFLLTRIRLHGDLHLGPNLRVFVEGKSALSTDRDLPGGRRTLDVDELALQQAFADLIIPLGDAAELRLRGGRQDLLFGAQRLVSPLDWSNTRRTFDGVSAALKWENTTVTGFWTQLVEVDKYDFNQADAQSEFFGLYAMSKLPFAPVGIDGYFLVLDREDPVTFNATTGFEDRYTVGGRLFGSIADTGFDYDFEGAYQFGEVGSADIDAFMVALEVGHKFADAAMAPRLWVGFDYASGDKSAGGDVQTFNQLFPLGHAYHGWIDLVGRQNIIDMHAGISFQPTKPMTVTLAAHYFRRADDNDALYNAGGARFRPAGAAAVVPGMSREVGAEFDLLIKYQFDQHLQGFFGYSHFWPGNFIEQTGPNEDIDFVYGILQYTF